MRAEGAVMLTQELENAEPEKFALLLPYMGSFIKFLGTLSEEASPKVCIYRAVHIRAGWVMIGLTITP